MFERKMIVTRRDILLGSAALLVAGNGAAAAPAPQVQPFGAWKSPVTSDMLTVGNVSLSMPRIDGDNVYWLEGRPQEQGRTVLMRRLASGVIEEVTPAPANARTRVHEYGGGAYAVSRGKAVYANFTDQRLYIAGKAAALTEEAALRYADFIFDHKRDRLISVREDHREKGNTVNCLVAVSLSDGTQKILAEGHDFFSSPRLSPDGSRLAWLSWNHPDMPWDATTLRVADILPDGSLGAPAIVAGGAAESVFQPEWSPKGELHFISDRSGWWNLYRLRGGKAEALNPQEAEFGLPQWVFGMSTYGFDKTGRILCSCSVKGRSRLLVLEPDGGRVREIATGYDDIGSLQVGPDWCVFLGAGPTEPRVLARLSFTDDAVEILQRSGDRPIGPEFVSVPEAIEFPTEGGLTAHAYFYPPRNPDFAAPPGGKPPLLVLAHGGPTGAASSSFSLNIQYWTSRGFAVVDVNYGGSSGYGRAYRQRLNGKWGIVDVDDSVNAARYLVKTGRVAENALAIRGGSAGGYTTLAALTFRDCFKAGASYFGIGDLETLARDTHKFESRYLDRLVGPYPAAQKTYYERSPVHFVDRLHCPMILFQGLDDEVVPPNQAKDMYDAVKAKGLPVAMLTFEHEGHGFRRAETIRRAQEAELYFYGKVFGFTPADAIEPVPM